MRAIVAVIAVCLQCAAIALFLVLVFFNPYAPVATGAGNEAPLQVVAMQLGLAILGAGVALWRKPILMLLIGLGQFVPIGFYLLGTPGIFRWVGIIDLAYLLIGAGLLMGKRTDAARG